MGLGVVVLLAERSEVDPDGLPAAGDDAERADVVELGLDGWPVASGEAAVLVAGADETGEPVAGPVGVGADVEQLTCVGGDEPADEVAVGGDLPGELGGDQAVAGDAAGVVGQAEQGRGVEDDGGDLLPAARAPCQ